jgi:hypothetical protein
MEDPNQELLGMQQRHLSQGKFLSHKTYNKKLESFVCTLGIFLNFFPVQCGDAIRNGSIGNLPSSFRHARDESRAMAKSAERVTSVCARF